MKLSMAGKNGKPSWFGERPFREAVNAHIGTESVLSQLVLSSSGSGTDLICLQGGVALRLTPSSLFRRSATIKHPALYSGTTANAIGFTGRRNEDAIALDQSGASTRSTLRLPWLLGSYRPGYRRPDQARSNVSMSCRNSTRGGQPGGLAHMQLV
jgi:hypothetical protein